MVFLAIVSITDDDRKGKEGVDLLFYLEVAEVYVNIFL